MTKQERLEVEIRACKRYAEKVAEQAREGKIGKAINFLDIAQTAKTCAEQVQKAHSETETLERAIQKAYKEIQTARS